jgi:DNA repair exonuclease SbcCD ATPase subunit
MLLTVLVLGVSVPLLAYLAWRFSTEATRLRVQYAPILQMDAAVAAAKEDLERTRAAHQEGRALADREREQFLREDQERRAKLNAEYTEALATYETLKRELALVEVGLEDVSFGLYKAHFNFQTPEEYKTALTALRERERSLIHDGQAAVCPVQWTVGNSAHEGARMVKQNIKLILRAFNGESDAARADVSWNNITKMEERIRKSCEAINKLSGVLQVTITNEYLTLKLNELRLTHEYEERKYQDREEQRRIREQIREEERAQREFDKAREEAETEEARYQKALVKAREEAAAATGVALERLTAQVSAFEAKLDEARKKKERAIARAQITKSGFVYVISNVGSFGERVYKIGMTRRLEPWNASLNLAARAFHFPSTCMQCSIATMHPS